MKAYETYSGFKNFNINCSPDDVEHYNKIAEIGGEIGATTGRKRKIRWTTLDDIIKALYINNVTDLIINKIDVLEELGVYSVYYKGDQHTFVSSESFMDFVQRKIVENYKFDLNITWSRSREHI